MIVMCLSTFAGGAYYIYYGYVFVPFMVFGISYLINYCINIRLNRIIAIALLGASLIFGYTRSINIPFMKISKDNLPQFKFAKMLVMNLCI